jgi:hypothetical protein
MTLLYCTDINSWSEMNAFSQPNTTAAGLYMKLATPLILSTAALNTTHMISLLTSHDSHHRKAIRVNGLLGLDLFPWLNPTQAPLTLTITRSLLRFYLKEKPLIESACERGITYANVSIFLFFQRITVNNDVRYYADEPLCPYVFSNTTQFELALLGQVTSITYNNVLRFKDYNTSDSKSINSNADYFTLGGYNYRLDTGIFHPLVFELVEHVCFQNTIGYLQNDLFKHFPFLYTITFEMENAGNFYHKYGIEWMLYLQNTSLVNMTEFNDTSLDLYKSIYKYPDSDFCLFAKFPFQNSIFLFPDCDALNACTVTLKFLARSNNYSYDPYGISCSIYDICNSSQTEISDSTVASKLALCNLSNYSKSDTIYPDYYENRLLSVFIINLLPFIFIPCSCVIGFFLNLLVIHTINKNKAKELKEDMYKYMKVNAIFNCIYCFIFLFYPINNCLEYYVSEFFCSSIYSTQFAQYFKIVVMTYFGEVFKMCANISYIMMTLNRYLLVGKDHAHWLVAIAKVEIKILISGTFIFSALINIGHGFEYQIKNPFLIPSHAGYNDYSDSHNRRFLNLNINVNKTYVAQYPTVNIATSYFVYSIGYFVVNFGFFFVINTLIEVQIVRRMHKELEEKRERVARMKINKFTSISSTTSTDSSNASAEAEDEKKERRVIIMVVVNSLLNFILRFPDFFIFLEENSNSWMAHLDNMLPGFPALLLHISYLSYILTFSFNVFVFYKFNSKFKEAFVNLFKTN